MTSTYVVRAWLPDRPGALGALASRIGAVGGDVLGIEILESGAGRVIDELVVAIPSSDLLDLLIAEIHQVDGVDVESVRPAPPRAIDTTVAALEAAAAIVESPGPTGACAALVERAAALVDADWSVVFDTDRGSSVASTGDAPPSTWIGAFVAGSVAAGHPEEVAAGGDTVCLELTPTCWFVLGRDGRDLRWRERREVALLARLAAVMVGR